MRWERERRNMHRSETTTTLFSLIDSVLVVEGEVKA